MQMKIKKSAKYVQENPKFNGNSNIGRNHAIKKSNHTKLRIIRQIASGTMDDAKLLCGRLLQVCRRKGKLGRRANGLMEIARTRHLTLR